jgi:hypothetical protein
MASFTTPRDLVVHFMSTGWAFLERYGWFIVGAAVLAYAYGPLALDSLELLWKRARYDRTAAYERAAAYEEVRRQRMEDLQARVNLAAERKREREGAGGGEGPALKPRPAQPALDEERPARDPREYNPLMGPGGGGNSRIRSSMRDKKGGGGGG